VATAASTALPPALSTSRPTWVEYGLTLTTAPPEPTATAVLASWGSPGGAEDGLADGAHAVTTAAQHTRASTVRTATVGSLRS